MKFLIAGLGNVGSEYEGTRHNAGFEVLDELARSSGTLFINERYAFMARMRHRGKQFILIKPTTYMNLSGQAVRYWLQKEDIAIENLLVVTDDIALPFGKLRMKVRGSDGGHNGLRNIGEVLETEAYARLRIGVGSDFARGRQVDYVLGPWNEDEKKALPEILKKAVDAVLSFGIAGAERTMNVVNIR